MRFNGLITAFRTLTILPVPGHESDDLASALPWFPLVGLLLGTFLALAGRLWTHAVEGWSGGGAVLLLIASVLLTRGLHMDGLADWADALGGRPDRETRLAIMKDPGLGAFGAVALGLVLLAQWTALERILDLGDPCILLLPWIVTRTMMAELAGTLPYARPGAGTAGPFVHGASGGRRLVALVAGLMLSTAWGAAGLLCFFAAWGATRLFARHCRKVFGGVTGDLLGALNEILATGILLAFSGLPGPTHLWYTGTGFF
ncbi:MAG: adenosylcobinamide-GDP ribazoletransferase [Deltaproteobacteria bacterium]|nr:adenosylcobinamide-GDP ribazoletransferase [Deltaproteobacteria bacterium]